MIHEVLEFSGSLTNTNDSRYVNSTGNYHRVENHVNGIDYRVSICNTTSDDDYKYFYHVAQITTGLIFYPVICVTGIMGNVLVSVSRFS